MAASVATIEDTIRLVATSVREEMENLVKVYFHEDSPWNAPDDMEGLCAHGAHLLWEALTLAGFEPLVMYNLEHWFVHCSGYLVDVTASQFGKGNVIVRRLPILDGEDDPLWFWQKATQPPADEPLVQFIWQDIKEARTRYEEEQAAQHPPE